MAHIDTASLLAAVVAGDVARLRTMLPPTGDPAEDASPDVLRGVTPLMVAAAFGNEPMVELLLLQGADPARRDANGRTAAAYARAAGHPHLAARLDTVVEKENTVW
jgi:ankyrin repeat protein